MGTVLERYEGPAQIFYQGRLLAEASSVRVRVIGNNNKVVTMTKQFAGKSDGPTESAIDIESAVPFDGFERDFMSAVINKDVVRVVVKAGGKRVQISAYCEESEYSAQTDASAGISVSMVGGPPEMIGAGF